MKPAVTDDGSDIGLLSCNVQEHRHLPFKLMIFIVDMLGGNHHIMCIRGIYATIHIHQSHDTIVLHC